MKEILTASVETTSINLIKKTFSTGSEGYHGSGKSVIDGVPYQINFMLIEEGSAPTAKAESRAGYLNRKKEREA